MGFRANASGEHAATVGFQATASGKDSFAASTLANASGKDSVAIGHSAAATGENTVAIGINNKAEGEGAVNIGSKNYGAYTNTTIVGSNNNIAHTDHMEDPEGDVILGTLNNMQDSFHGVLVGKNNQVNNADYAVAIGNDTAVNVVESVAIGHNSKADSVTGTASADIAGKTYTFAGGAPVGTVSVGDVNKERTVTNVAAGRISDTSTDAINGSQLHSVVTEVAKNKQNIKDLATGVNDLGGIVKDNSDAINDLNNRISSTGSNVLHEAKSYTDQQVSAASAALAGLHPLDFDKNDKWSYSVGLGNYKNANAAAIGVFYRPNKNTMFNVATTIGSGRGMISLGANFKFGKESEVVPEANQIKKDMADLTNKYNDLEQKYEQLLAKLSK